jgi:hypothetical protein
MPIAMRLAASSQIPHQLIRTGHALAEKLAQMANLDYAPHPLLKRALKRTASSPSLVTSMPAEAEATGSTTSHEHQQAQPTAAQN